MEQMILVQSEILTYKQAPLKVHCSHCSHDKAGKRGRTADGWPTDGGRTADGERTDSGQRTDGGLTADDRRDCARRFSLSRSTPCAHIQIHI